MKKVEKELLEARKQLDVKENTLDKARKDRDEMWLTINSDKYRNFKSIEEEKQKSESHVSEMHS